MGKPYSATVEDIESITNSLKYYSDIIEDYQSDKEIIDKEQAVLEFECTMGGVTVNGIDMFKWNSNNKLTEMKVMIRTEKALEAVKQEMTKNLSKPELWR